jgi:hypothetical protein
MKTVTINNAEFKVHDRLLEFNVNSITSKGISFFGSNPHTGSLFIQFAGGGTYIYTNITPEIRKGMFEAPSLGMYVTKNIVGKFPSEKLDGKGVFFI